MSARGLILITPTSTATRTAPSPRTGGIPGTRPPRVLSPNHPDVLALREAKQVALRSARVPFGATHHLCFLWFRGFERADLGRDRVALEALKIQFLEPAFHLPPAIAPPCRGELVHHHREDGGLGRPRKAVVQEELHDEDLPAGSERAPHPIQQGAVLLLIEAMDHVRNKHGVVAGSEVGR